MFFKEKAKKNCRDGDQKSSGLKDESQKSQSIIIDKKNKKKNYKGKMPLFDKFW